MDYKLEDLIDVSLFQQMLDSLNEFNSFPSAVIDNDSNVLTSSSWQDVCVNFHRVHPRSEKDCKLSDKYISDHLDEAKPTLIYRCPRGMVDCATPIAIGEKHLGNFFTGQFFFEKPDLEFYREQASLFGFEESAYLEAVEKVPVRTKEQLDKYLLVVRNIVEILVRIGSEKLKNIESLKTIQENEERFKSLFDRAPDAIFLADTETGIILDANYAATKLIGKPVSEIIGMNHLQLHPERSEKYTKETFHDHAESQEDIGEIPTIENVVVHADGSEIPVEILASTITVNGKRIMQGVFRNISGMKRAENNLRIQHEISIILGQTSDLNHAMNRLLESVCQLEGIDCGRIYIVDQASGNIDMTAHCGLSEEFISQNLYFTPDSVNAAIVNCGKPVFRSYTEILSRNVPVIIQEKLRSTSIIPIVYNGVAIASFHLASHQFDEIPDDTRIALLSIASSLGATILRITSEKQLQESEEKYKLSFRTSPDSININAIDGTYVDINDGFTALTGYTKEDAIGVSSLDLNIWAIPEDRERLIAGLKKDGRVENLESVFLMKDGSQKTALMSASLITLNNKPHILSITRDITDRKKVLTELIEAKEKAEESDNLKSAFLANMSHELRTPMNGILGFSELLDDDSLTNEERREYISVINDSGQGLLDVITKIMDISKIDSRQLEKKVKSFNLNGLLDELLKGFQSEKILREKTHLKLALIKALPDEQSTIISDQGKIRYIFNLLLNNAVKFTREGFVHFGYKISGQQVIFFVQDTGKGISPEKQNAVFERFRQEDETMSRKYGGVGLGLTIAKGLVEVMDGKIWVESESGKGSTFWFEFPVN